MDVLLHEWKRDLLRIWVPMVAAASMLIGLFGGMEIQGCRDAATAAATPSQTAAQPGASEELQTNGLSNASQDPQERIRHKVRAETGRER
jgi:hypothetical protein